MTFGNSILSGNTLVREAISSENYVSGTSGWSIERDGDAEFNDVTVRGSVIAVGPNGETAELTVNASGLPSLRFRNAAGTLTFSIVLDDINSDITQTFVNKNGETYRIHLSDNRLNIANAVNSGIVIHQGDAQVRFVTTTLSSGLTVAQTSDGFLKAGVNNGSVHDWTNIAMVSGWAHDPGHLVPGGKLLPHGSVELCGGATGGPGGTSTLSNALPAANLIPPQDVRIPIMSNVSGAVGSGEARMVIRGVGHAAPGRMEIFNVGAGASISLDGCTYPVDR